MLGRKSSEYKRVYSLVYDWGKKHLRLLDLKTEDDEIKHFGKRIKDFTRDEREGYDDGCYDIEYYFEAESPNLAERLAECWGDDY